MGVYQESGRTTWRFEIWKHGVRVLTKGGYPTQREAIIAEDQFAQNLNLINIGFERLTNERLKDLSITRTKKYHREVERFFEKLRGEGWHLKKEISRDDLEDYLNKVALEKGNQTANKYMRYIRAFSITESNGAGSRITRPPELKPNLILPKRGMFPR